MRAPLVEIPYLLHGASTTWSSGPDGHAAAIHRVHMAHIDAAVTTQRGSKQDEKGHQNGHKGPPLLQGSGSGTMSQLIELAHLGLLLWLRVTYRRLGRATPRPTGQAKSPR